MEEIEIDLDCIVSIKISGEVGITTGVAFYVNSEPQFRVHYKAANGCACEQWFYADQLELIRQENPAH